MKNKSPKKKSESIESRPDGWKLFEGAVDVAMKTPPKPNAKATKPSPKGKKKRSQ